ncbi:MAG: SRPBCC family protein [Aquisalinus sp.]|nr:SRPBCC family protein [Aquisalinus sp.]
MAATANLTLSITRHIEAPRNLVWRCWTDNDLIKKWFVPKPWYLAEADMDVRSGGRMNMVIAGPEGERVESDGCFLKVLPETRLVFTDAYTEGFMPRPQHFMTGVVDLSDAADSTTQMIWSARHATAETRQQHLDMNFEQGWNAAADQLNELAKSLNS